jgi:hypothetical protein
MDNFLEIFFGKRKTPSEILAEIAKEARAAERIMAREAKRAEKESLKAFADAQKWHESAWPFEVKEGQLQSCYLIAKQSQDRGKRYAMQAAVLRDFATEITVMSSNVDMMKAQLRASSVFGRLARMLPNSQQLCQIAQQFALSKQRQEMIQEQLGDEMRDNADDLFANAGGTPADERESPHEWVRKKMTMHRIEAGVEREDADELLAQAPRVLSPRRLSGSAPVGLTTSASAPPPDDNDGADE